MGPGSNTPMPRSFGWSARPNLKIYKDGFCQYLPSGSRGNDINDFGCTT